MGGRKIRNTMSGSRRITGTFGSALRASPPTTRRVGKEEVARQRGQDEHGHEQDDGDLEIVDAGHFLDAHRSKAGRASGDEEGVERKWTRASARRGRRGGSPPPPGAGDRAAWRDA